MPLVAKSATQTFGSLTFRKSGGLLIFATLTFDRGGRSGLCGRLHYRFLLWDEHDLAVLCADFEHVADFNGGFGAKVPRYGDTSFLLNDDEGCIQHGEGVSW